jgi:hypothetical protein
MKGYEDLTPTSQKSTYGPFALPLVAIFSSALPAFLKLAVFAPAPRTKKIKGAMLPLLDSRMHECI